MPAKMANIVIGWNY